MAEEKLLGFLYGTPFGRLLLRPLVSRPLSKAAGWFLDSGLSRPLIRPFLRKNKIDLDQYLDREFPSFNACFTRRIKPELRPMAPAGLMAPCDGRLSLYTIRDDTVLPVKQSRYTISGLLQDAPLARRYEGGLCLVFRLCVDDYHRYCYLDDGRKGENFFLPGKLHTVRPVALAQVPVFTENCREYTLLQTKTLGPVLQVEVGAMLVGRIQNDHGPGLIRRGQEKGRFLYGGSTILVLLEKDRVRLLPDYAAALDTGRELPVRMGMCLGDCLPH